MVSNEFALFKKLLQQLGSELEKLEAWSQSLQDENLRLRHADTSTSSNCNGNSSDPVLKLQDIDMLGEILEQSAAGEILATLPSTECAFESANKHVGVDSRQGLTFPSCEAELCEMSNNSPARSGQRVSFTCAEEKELSEQRQSPFTGGEGKDLLEQQQISSALELEPKFQEQLSASSDYAQTFKEEEGIQELRVWFQKLLDKDAPQNQDGVALSSKFIYSLFVETDVGCRGENWVSSAISQFNDVVLSKSETTYSWQRQNLQQHMFARTVSCRSMTRSRLDNVQNNMLAFDAFVELINWKWVEAHLGPRLKRDVVQIREVLIRNSVDELIFEFSGLAPPKKQKQPAFWTRTIEPLVGCVVVINSITIGISSDHAGWGGWAFFEVVYTLFFLCEIILKLHLYGFRHQFLGPDKYWNTFDVVIVSLAFIDLVISVVAGAESSLGNLTLMRLARLAKITRVLRIVRLIRLRFFRELLLLIRGVAAGMRTLAWAFVLLASLVYIIGVLLRQTIGASEDNAKNLVVFRSVGSSMFTVFRCFIGDCSQGDGTPILANLYEVYGYAFVIPWAVVTLFVTFGMFNLIMAVFVENVQENAKLKRELTRDDERAQVVTRMRQLVMMFGGRNKSGADISRTFSFEGLRSATMSLGSTNMDVTNVHFQFGGTITREMFMEVICEPEMHRILDDLDVHVADRTELFDLLDADRNKTVDLSELILGILKLRSGGADKSDIVGTVLGIRSIQKQLSSFIDIALEQQTNIKKELVERIDIMNKFHLDLKHSLQALVATNQVEL